VIFYSTDSTVEVNYADGEQYPYLERNDTKLDLPGLIINRWLNR
jgi:hypothetical protein